MLKRVCNRDSPDDLGRFENILSGYNDVAALKPEHAEVWNNKGFSLTRLGRFEEALSVFDQGIALKPDDARAWFFRGFSLSRLVGSRNRCLRMIAQSG